jgi:hypothetical protein
LKALFALAALALHPASQPAESAKHGEQRSAVECPMHAKRQRAGGERSESGLHGAMSSRL